MTFIDIFDFFFHTLLKGDETPAQVAEKNKRDEVVCYLLSDSKDEGASSDVVPTVNVSANSGIHKPLLSGHPIPPSPPPH